MNNTQYGGGFLRGGKRKHTGWKVEITEPKSELCRGLIRRTKQGGRRWATEPGTERNKVKQEGTKENLMKEKNK